MSYHFFAMMRRLRYIRRWSLMKNSEPENVQEHSHEVATIAHLLAAVRRELFAAGRVCPDPAAVALKALYHDAAEILTGDLPTPVKYFDENIRSAYARIEEAAGMHLLSMVPEFLSGEFAALLAPGSGAEAEAVDELVKAADRLSALIKCTVEVKAGNREFVRALETVRERLTSMALPEVDWFCEHMLPAYTLSLDELRGAF